MKTYVTEKIIGYEYENKVLKQASFSVKGTRDEAFTDARQSIIEITNSRKHPIDQLDLDVLSVNLVKLVKQADNKEKNENPLSKDLEKSFSHMPEILKEFLEIEEYYSRYESYEPVYLPILSPAVELNYNLANAANKDVRIGGLKGLVLEELRNHANLSVVNILLNLSLCKGFYTLMLIPRGNSLTLCIQHFSYEPLLTNTLHPKESNDLTHVLVMRELKFDIRDRIGLNDLYGEFGFLNGLWMILLAFNGCKNPGKAFGEYLYNLIRDSHGTDKRLLEALFKHVRNLLGDGMLGELVSTLETQHLTLVESASRHVKEEPSLFDVLFPRTTRMPNTVTPIGKTGVYALDEAGFFTNENYANIEKWFNQACAPETRTKKFVSEKPIDQLTVISAVIKNKLEEYEKDGYKPQTTITFGQKINGEKISGDTTGGKLTITIEAIKKE